MIGNNHWKRDLCNQCNRSCKYYCSFCYQSIGVPNNINVPIINPPLKIDIIFQDKPKKSTAPQAKTLAFNDVELITYTSIINNKENSINNTFPTYNKEETLVLYPTEDAKRLNDFNLNELIKVKKIIIIDCPWQKAPVLLSHQSLIDLNIVKLSNPPKYSNFWRYHEAGEGCLSTIEAIDLFFNEYSNVMNIKMNHSFLYFFQLQYNSIRNKNLNNEFNSNQIALPMDEKEKMRQRNIRNQKDKSNKIKIENKKRKVLKTKIVLDGTDTIDMTNNIKDGRCYNCKKSSHEAKNCPEVCRYCKQMGHWSGGCKMKIIKQNEHQNRTLRTEA